MPINKVLSASEFDKRYNIIDEYAPRHVAMTGHYKKSFAYYTLRERLPVILTSVIDNLTKDKDELVDRFGKSAREEIKTVVGKLSKLKYQLQTNKRFEEFIGNEPDRQVWNEFLNSLPPENSTFFNACWLYAECYMYRKMRSFFEATATLNTYDYFSKQKQNALTCCVDTLEAVASCTRNTTKDLETFSRLIKLNLWGNRCDLSISAGKEIKQTGNQFELIKSFDSNILINQTLDIWKCILNADTNKPIIIDYICDNAGYELFTDLLLADYLIQHKLAQKIRFNVKAIPWFISDVTPDDFEWTLKFLQEQNSDVLNSLAKKWRGYLSEGKFELAPADHFWTSPYEFYQMYIINPELFKQLREARLIIFKGDLNYRKLISDFTWDPTEEFITCLRGFQPTNLCTLRTIKADLICGLEVDVANTLTKKQGNWMTTGEYGVIQFMASDGCDCFINSEDQNNGIP